MYKSKISIFGNDSEYYIEQLFGLDRVKNGNNMFDFKSSDFQIPFFLELKSGMNNKSILNHFQLAHPIDALKKIFGWNIDQINSYLSLDYLKQNDSFLKSVRSSFAFYYTAINRTDNLLTSQVNSVQGKLNITWGNTHFVPYKYILAQFAAMQSRRMNEDPLKVFNIVKNGLLSYFSDEPTFSNFNYGRGPQSWQNLFAKDVERFVLGKELRKNLTQDKRLNLLRQIYPEVDDLEKISFKGPNGTENYVLCYPEHKEIFDVYLRKKVIDNIPKIEFLTQERIRQAKTMGKKKNDVILRLELIKWGVNDSIDNVVDGVPF